jgi:hypothetical protein
MCMPWLTYPANIPWSATMQFLQSRPQNLACAQLVLCAYSGGLCKGAEGGGRLFPSCLPPRGDCSRPCTSRKEGEATHPLARFKPECKCQHQAQPCCTMLAKKSHHWYYILYHSEQHYCLSAVTHSLRYKSPDVTWASAERTLLLKEARRDKTLSWGS